MTTTAFGSALVFWLVHSWSDVLGEQISAGEAFRHRDVLVVPVASSHSSKRPSFRRSSSREPRRTAATPREAAAAGP